MLNKTEVCNFCFSADANKTAIVGNSVARSEHSCSARACERCKVIWCDVNRTLKFERRSRAADEDDYERKTLWSRGVLAEHLFSALF